MILFIDLEHEDARDMPWGNEVMANRTKVTYRLQEISGEVCLLQHYSTVEPDLIDELGIKAVFLSGSSTDPDMYPEGDLERMRELVRTAPVPIFGFCGGFQLMAEAHGSKLVRIGPLEEGDHKAEPAYMPGWKTETGYQPVRLVEDHPILDGINPDPVFRHFHGWEIDRLTTGFTNLASTDITTIQFGVNEKLKQVGTQFHPEYYTDENPAGRRLIENFCRWSGVLGQPLRT